MDSRVKSASGSPNDESQYDYALETIYRYFLMSVLNKNVANRSNERICFILYIRRRRSFLFSLCMFTYVLPPSLFLRFLLDLVEIIQRERERETVSGRGIMYILSLPPSPILNTLFLSPFCETIKYRRNLFVTQRQTQRQTDRQRESFVLHFS